MLAGDTHYPPSFGTPELLDAIVGKLARENNVHVTRDQILVTPGAKWAIYATLAVTTNPGDEVLVLDPAWVSYGPMVQLQQATPVHVTLPSADDFRITARAEEYVTPRTKLIMVNSPNNPTGRVLSRTRSTPSFRSRPQSLRAQRRDLRAHHL
ncbi:MAG: aminotransferase class I/II-fold pyridoxal phosphate-dependent enzyme [Caldilineaceae bacterium]